MTRAASEAVIAGRMPVREALEEGTRPLEKIFVQHGAGGKPISEIRRLARKAGVPVQHVPAGRVEQEARGLNHQGVVALAAPIAYHVFEEMLADIAPTLDEVRARKPLLLVLDRITDPHNFGAILRSAVAAGASGVVVPDSNMAPLNATVVKTSAGTAGKIPVARVKRLRDALYQLKERGYWIAAAEGGGDTSMWELDWDRPFALVIGSEGEGLRRTVSDECDFHVSIPLRGPVESLNASVAAGILLFVATRDRGDAAT